MTTPTGADWPLAAVLDALALVVLDDGGDAVRASPAVQALAPDDADESDLGAVVHPDDADRVAGAIAAVLDGDRETRRVRFRWRPDPDRRLALRVTGFGDGTDGEAAAVALLTDATDDERDRRALSDLGSLLDSLLAASSREAVGRTFQDWTGRLPGTTVTTYRYDGDAGRLSPVESDDGPESVPEAVRAAYRTGTPRVRRGDETHEVVVPVGDHGALLAAVEDGRLPDDRLVEAVSPLATVLGLALDRVGYADALAVARQVASEAHADYRRLRTLASTVRRAETRILQAETPQAIHEALCEELTATDLFTFAWVGAVDFQARHLDPTAWAGDGRAYLDRIDLEMEGDVPPPAVAAARDREQRHVSEVAGGARTAPWRREALACGFQSVVAVPIGDDEGLLGVLSVYDRDADSFDRESRLALAHLGAVAGFAINALELRRTFFGATSVEVKLHVPATDTALGRFASDLDATVEVLSVVPGEEGASRLFFTVDRAPETVLAAGEATPGVGSVTHHPDRADVPVFETSITDQELLQAVTAHGAILSAASADAEGLWLTVKLGQDVEVRTYVEAVQGSFPETEIVARRIREEPVEASHRLRADYEDQLSDRQREVFEAAYFGGYFNWPRDRTGSEVADSIGIAQPTFSRHLRAAERKLAALLFERPE
ncbi:bacterio-opsin activator domain-containing protein [Halobacteriales archaeon Cl-PHB]